MMPGGAEILRQVRPPKKKEKKELERMTQQEVGRVALRAQMILLSARGFSVPDIANIQDTSDVTLYNWLDRFDAEGPAGLYDRPREGRPPKVTEHIEEVVEETMSQPPTEQNYNFTYWTVPLLVEHLKRTVQESFCAETIRTLLHRLGFRCRRPRWAVVRDDPQKAERMRAIAQAILTAEEETVVLLEDETIFKSLPPLRKMWMRIGQQTRIPTPFQNNDTCLYGALELNQGECVYAFHDKAKSENTIAYLEQLLAHYPDQPILLIWDQARFHTSQLVEEWLADHPRITTMLLPKYAPELNPIEDIWQVLKDRVAANLTRSIEAIQAACIRFFDEEQPTDLLRMAGLLA